MSLPIMSEIEILSKELLMNLVERSLNELLVGSSIDETCLPESQGLLSSMILE